MQSTGVARGDGLSVSVYTRAALDPEKESDVLVVEVNIPFDALKDFLPPPTGGPVRSGERCADLPLR